MAIETPPINSVDVAQVERAVQEDPAGPAAPVALVVPEGPADPVAPVALVVPESPAVPAVPVALENPAVPVALENPAVPVVLVALENPAGPTKDPWHVLRAAPAVSLGRQRSPAAAISAVINPPEAVAATTPSVVGDHFVDTTNKKEYVAYKKYPNSLFAKKEKIVPIDINQATQEDLIKINGIGEAFATRILKQKESLGGFVSMEQMNEVWGLTPEVIENLNTHFKVSVLPSLKKIDINNVSLKELSQFPYFKYPLAKQILIFSSMNGDIKGVGDLVKIKDFPVGFATTSDESN